MACDTLTMGSAQSRSCSIAYLPLLSMPYNYSFSHMGFIKHWLFLPYQLVIALFAFFLISMCFFMALNWLQKAPNRQLLLANILVSSFSKPTRSCQFCSPHSFLYLYFFFSFCFSFFYFVILYFKCLVCANIKEFPLTNPSECDLMI